MLREKLENIISNNWIICGTWGLSNDRDYRRNKKVSKIGWVILLNT